MICRIIQINHLIMIQRLWDDYGWYNWDNDLPYLHLDQTNIVNTLRLCRSKVDLFCLSFHLQGQIPWRGKRHTKLESNTVGVGHVGPLELSPTFSNYHRLGTVQTWIVTETCSVFCHLFNIPRPRRLLEALNLFRNILLTAGSPAVLLVMPMWPTKKQLPVCCSCRFSHLWWSKMGRLDLKELPSFYQLTLYVLMKAKYLKRTTMR